MRGERAPVVAAAAPGDDGPLGGEAATQWVLPFADPRARQLALVGGKGASLAELVDCGLPVPDGFCVSTDAFRRFLTTLPGAELQLAAMSSLSASDTEAIRAAASSFRSLLAGAELPTAVARAVLAEHRRLGSSARYAVRSSATTEDLDGASFAGQHDTYLGVVGGDRLLEGVAACWRSLYTDRAVAYRRQQGIPEAAAAMAVVVQRMVDAEVAGVLFTADPLTGRRDVCTVDASYGLGEAVVSGIVTPDAYTVEKIGGAVRSRRLGSKKLAIVPRPTGGTETVDVPPQRQTAYALSDADAGALAALGAAVESLKGQPQDVEWCLKGGRVFLLQSRPITSLYPLPTPQRPGPIPRAYVCLGHQQANPAVWSPMANSLFAVLPPFGKETPDGRSTLVATAGHRLYVDVTELLLARPFRTILPRLLNQLSPAIGERLRLVAERPDYVAARRRLSVWPLLRLLAPVVPRALAWLFVRRPESAGARWERFLGTYAATLERHLDAARSPTEVLRVAQRTIANAPAEVMMLMAAPILVPGMALYAALHRLMSKRIAAGTVERLSGGLEGNIVTRMDLELGDLADHVRAVPGLAEVLAAAPPRRAIEAAGRHPGGERFAALWTGFIDRWGHRGPGELDIAAPRWSDDPTSLLRSLLGMLHSGDVGDHRRRFEAARADALRARAELLAAAGRGLLGPLRRRLVRWMVRRIRSYVAMREHHKYAIIAALSRLRGPILEIGADAATRGWLDDAESVWMLDYEELIDVFAAPASERDAIWSTLRRRVCERRVAHARFAEMFPPAVLLSTGEIPPMPDLHAELPVDALGGVPVSGGVVEGAARVLRDPSRETLLPGEILVAPCTDAAWTTLFVHAGGVVLEAGGMMSHGSVVAREYGIPAVVGVEGATATIRTGQRIRVDGDAGVVTMLADAASPPPSAEVEAR